MARLIMRAPRIMLPTLPEDPYWTNVISLLHLDGSDGSTSIIDVKGKTWTANGTAQLDTARSKFGTASLLLDGTGLGIFTSATAGTGPGTGDFTYECWVYRTRTVTSEVLICARNATASSFGNVLAIRSGALAYSNGSAWLATSIQVPLNQWSHVAACRASGTLRLFIDGVSGLQTSLANSYPAPDTINIGSYDNSTVETFAGSIDEVRLTNGVARYTANFTPPSAPFPNQ